MYDVIRNSFTDRVFPARQPTQFVGLDNYVQLLSMTVQEVPPKIDEATGQPKINCKTGTIDYKSTVQVLPPRAAALGSDPVQYLWPPMCWAQATRFYQGGVGHNRLCRCHRLF